MRYVGGRQAPSKQVSSYKILQSEGADGTTLHNGGVCKKNELGYVIM